MKVTTNSTKFKMKHTATDMPDFSEKSVSTPNNGNVTKTDQGVLVRFKNPLTHTLQRLIPYKKN